MTNSSFRTDPVIAKLFYHPIPYKWFQSNELAPLPPPQDLKHSITLRYGLQPTSSFSNHLDVLPSQYQAFRETSRYSSPTPYEASMRTDRTSTLTNHHHLVHHSIPKQQHHYQHHYHHHQSLKHNYKSSGCDMMTSSAPGLGENTALNTPLLLNIGEQKDTAVLYVINYVVDGFALGTCYEDGDQSPGNDPENSVLRKIALLINDFNLLNVCVSKYPGGKTLIVSSCDSQYLPYEGNYYMFNSFPERIGDSITPWNSTPAFIDDDLQNEELLHDDADTTLAATNHLLPQDDSFHSSFTTSAKLLMHSKVVLYRQCPVCVQRKSLCFCPPEATESYFKGISSTEYSIGGLLNKFIKAKSATNFCAVQIRTFGKSKKNTGFYCLAQGSSKYGYTSSFEFAKREFIKFSLLNAFVPKNMNSGLFGTKVAPLIMNDSCIDDDMDQVIPEDSVSNATSDHHIFARKDPIDCILEHPLSFFLKMDIPTRASTHRDATRSRATSFLVQGASLLSRIREIHEIQEPRSPQISDLAQQAVVPFTQQEQQYTPQIQDMKSSPRSKQSDPFIPFARKFTDFDQYHIQPSLKKPKSAALSINFLVCDTDSFDPSPTSPATDFVVMKKDHKLSLSSLRSTATAMVSNPSSDGATTGHSNGSGRGILSNPYHSSTVYHHHSTAESPSLWNWDQEAVSSFMTTTPRVDGGSGGTAGPTEMANMANMPTLPSMPTLPKLFDQGLSQSLRDLSASASVSPSVLASASASRLRASSSSYRSNRDQPDQNLSSKVYLHDAEESSNTANATCPECHKVLNRVADLKRHVLVVHNKTRAFQCTQCPSSFQTKWHLADHVRRLHEKLKNMKCQNCSLSFAGRGDLTKHIRSVHEKIRDHVCTQCDAAFARKFDLKRHVLKRHSEKIS